MTVRGFPEVESPTNTRGATPAPSDRDGKPGAKDDLLSLAKTDPEKLAERLLSEWTRSTEDIKNYNEQWKVNLARSEGYLGARLDKVQDRQEAWIPYGAGPSLTGLDKAARLSRRLRSAIFADPPVPDVIPTTGQDIAADTAQFQERILQDESSEGRLGYAVLAADAFEVGKDYGSGFLHFYIDPEGRGPAPVQIKAHPDAMFADDPLLERPTPGNPPPSPKAPILKYVTAEGMLTAKRHGEPLKHQFLPKLCGAVLTGRHVHFLPSTARDLWDATGVILGGMVPLGDVKATFPSVAKMSDEELAGLVSYRPSKAEELLPREQRKYLKSARVSDSALVFQLLRYELSTGASPKGSYFALIGDSHVAHAGVWWDEEHDEALDLPLTQFMQYRQFGNPYGTGSTQALGGGSELLALMLDAMLEHMDRFGDQKVFVPTTSSVRPEQLEAESHRYIPVSPQGQPSSEQVPDFPVVIEKMYGRISSEMDDESALGQSGQAQQSSNVKSARHFQANLQQVQVLLSDLRQNTGRGLTRGWRVMAQLMRAYYTIPQLLRWSGEDGAYHVKEWAGADLVGLGDVQIAQGSFTQMLPAQKAGLARELYLTDHVLSPDQYKRIVFGQVNAILSLEDDPHFQRVKRQIDRWLEGPPQGWQPPVAPVDPRTGQPMVNPQTGQPMPAPPDPLLADIFDVRPADDEPQVAAQRMQELGRVIATSKFAKFPPPWQAGIMQAYGLARQAAQMVDAKAIQALKKQAADAQQKPTLSFSVKLADLNAVQSAAVIQQEGIKIPAPQPAAPVTPVAAPPTAALVEELNVELKKHQMTLEAEVKKQAIATEAELKREAIKSAGRAKKQKVTKAPGGGFVVEPVE